MSIVTVSNSYCKQSLLQIGKESAKCFYTPLEVVLERKENIMRYKEDWELTKKRFTAFWDWGNPGPLLRIRESYGSKSKSYAGAFLLSQCPGCYAVSDNP